MSRFAHDNCVLQWVYMMSDDSICTNIGSMNQNNGIVNIYWTAKEKSPKQSTTNSYLGTVANN